VETINREASDKTKGFRLQKMRAIRLMLDQISKSSRDIFYTAIENVEDVSHAVIDNEGTDQYYEEDKNYDKEVSFTLFTDAVKNTLVSFFDIYVGSWRSSNSVHMGFYTTASIGKEQKKLQVDQELINPPEHSILGLLSSGNDISSETCRYIKEALLQEYKSQYSKKVVKGNLGTLEAIDDKGLVNFFNKIHWYFGAENEEELKESLLESIRESSLYNIRHANKEEIIFSLLMEILDERQKGNDLVQKVIFSPDVELLFKQAESELTSDILDPVWTHLEEAASEIKDKRNLQEKIESVCPSYATQKTKLHARIACRSKTEQAGGNKSFLSLKYRVFEACSEHMIKNHVSSINEEKVDSVIDELKCLSTDYIEELKKDYSYTVSNKAVINGVVMDLFDGCFIAFDEDQSNG
jgi:hypothetical protein